MFIPCRWREPAGLLLLLSLGCGRGPSETYRDVVVDYSDKSVELVAGLDVAQVFRPNHHHLTAVAIMMSNPGRRARDCDVVFRLRAKDSTTDIVVRKTACADVPEEGWVRFDFPPLPATEGWRLVFSIASPNGRPGQAPLIFIASMPGIYADGKLRLNNEVVSGALQFTSFHR